MYVIRDKTSREHLVYHCVAYQPKLAATDFYNRFDANTMEMAWTQGEFEDFPAYFSINDNHQAVALTLEQAVAAGHVQLKPEEKLVDGQIVRKSNGEQVAEGLLQLEAHQKLVDDRIVDKSTREQVADGLIQLEEPFEYVDEQDNIQRYTVAQLVQQDLIKTRAVADICLAELSSTIEQAIQQAYSPGYESKLTKRYLAWLSEGKPADDRREQKFLAMQNRIEEIRLQSKGLWEKVKALRAKLKA